MNQGLTNAQMDALEVEYDKADEKGLEVFTFNGHEMLTSYVKYLLEYHKSKS